MNKLVLFLSMSVFILGFALVRYMSAPTSDPRQTNEIKSKPAAAICGTEAGADDRSRGTDCYENNNYALAIEYLSRHVEKDPNDSKSLAQIAISYTRLGRHEEAVYAYKKAISKNWMTYLFASLYADSLYAIGQKDDAIVWSKRALVLAPDCVDCRRDLAIQLKETGRKKEAMELLMTYDNEMKDQGKQQSFQGLIMIIQDELKSLN